MQCKWEKVVYVILRTFLKKCEKLTNHNFWTYLFNCSWNIYETAINETTNIWKDSFWDEVENWNDCRL